MKENFNKAFQQLTFGKGYSVKINYDLYNIYKNDHEASMDYSHDLKSALAYDNPYIILEGKHGTK